jgi:hypothetical protein
MFLGKNKLRLLLHKVLESDPIQSNPPVLLDLGASGEIFPAWQVLAPYSVCLALDADSRDFPRSEERKTKFRKLHLIQSLVAAETKKDMPFYHTRSPHCSSSLVPDPRGLASWEFLAEFEVKQTVFLPTRSLRDILEACQIDSVDWYKSDTQGTDLRIFTSLPDPLANRILAADFEPGIIDAYCGEDKLHDLMRHMEKRPFWISDMLVKGSRRICQGDLGAMNNRQKKNFRHALRTSPGWCEISYLNTMEDKGFTQRDFLLGWVFATLKDQHGFALALARVGEEKFGGPLFESMRSHSWSTLVSAGRKFSTLLQPFGIHWP